jgi:hypothetical protein
MPVRRGEDPSLDHLMQLMEHDQLSAMIVGHLVIESLLVKFLEMQPGADIDKILAFNCGSHQNKKFLDGSEKARLQWKLEGEFRQFEASSWTVTSDRSTAAVR